MRGGGACAPASSPGAACPCGSGGRAVREIAAEREGILAVGDRLKACGYAAVDDGVHVELVLTSPDITEAVSRVTALDAAHCSH